MAAKKILFLVGDFAEDYEGHGAVSGSHAQTHSDDSAL
jgi:hypothetical protein